MHVLLSYDHLDAKHFQKLRDGLAKELADSFFDDILRKKSMANAREKAMDFIEPKYANQETGYVETKFTPNFKMNPRLTYDWQENSAGVTFEIVDAEEIGEDGARYPSEAISNLYNIQTLRTQGSSFLPSASLP